ncbi:helix-turn-helix transcriptional regulator [Ferrimonas balearica]|uniref:helix-turn-helix transcriptional regulator n=1 Tax=Ferrimonas balearica TaxID=44012 RepID=UPI001F437888|nr:WYL domain-containing protein [Ferrimonas balearica]MBY6094680.1 WYL domain-containing protein [Ferrimonas balearica]
MFDFSMVGKVSVMASYDTHRGSARASRDTTCELFLGCLKQDWSNQDIHMATSEDRFRVIDFYLTFFGSFQRAKLMQHSEISVATASRDISAFKKVNPDEIKYLSKKKIYCATDSFCTQYSHDPVTALKYLAAANEVVMDAQYAGDVIQADKLDSGIVSNITRSIYNNTILKVDYYSARSGKGTREWSPHSVFHCNNSWYCRAFDRKRNEFRTFRLSRVLSTSELNECSSLLEREPNDVEWNEKITITLGPHKKHPYPGAVRLDNALPPNGVKNIHISAALAGFELTRLRVDASLGGRLDPHQFPLQVLNIEEVKDVSSIRMAPGFGMN